MKLTVTHNGKLIGKRTTDRVYTHVVALTNFNADAFRKVWADEWEKFGIDNAKGGHRHAGNARLTTYKYASVVSDAERAKYERIHATPLDQYIEEQRVAHFARVEKSVVDLQTKGDFVQSFAGRLDLAMKACKPHPYYTAIVLPVDQKSA